jgi:arylsulfatase A-like enzyme
MSGPNILLIMTDEERYPPPYEDAGVAEFRRTQMPARERIRTGGLELHRHYAGSTACAPSRATLFSGQYPSLHGSSPAELSHLTSVLGAERDAKRLLPSLRNP